MSNILYEKLESAANELIKRRKAKESFYEFLCYMFEKLYDTPYLRSPFAEEVCGILQTFAENTMGAKYEKSMLGRAPKKRHKEMIFAPPQHGKSEILKAFVAYCFFRWPNIKIAGASYGMSLAETVNKSIQRYITHPAYVAGFANLFNVKSTMNNEKFETTSGGVYLAVGVNGPLTGKGFDIGIIDDPYKDQPSTSDKRAVEVWFDEVFNTRQADHSGQVLIMTRWAVDDLSYYLERKPKSIEVPNKTGGYNTVDTSWKVHIYKAISDDGEPLTEHKGLGFLLEQKAMMPPSRWSSLYQQSPIIDGGGIIKVKNFKYYTVLPPKGWRETFMLIDSAIGESKTSDYTVLGRFGVSKEGLLYVLDIRRGQWDMFQSTAEIKAFRAKHNEHKVLLEVVAANASMALYQMLQREKIPVQKINPKGKKKADRVDVITQYIDSGYVYLPESAPWVSDFRRECEEFTLTDSHEHDDQVDVLTYACERTFIDKANSANMRII